MPRIPVHLGALAIALAAALPLGGQAAIIPPGVQLDPTQTVIRNNGSEPESLDPAIAETVGANNITRDLFEGLTTNDSDVVFGTSIGLSRALASETRLNATLEGNVLKLSWSGSGMILQNAGVFRPTNTLWFDLQVKNSPYYVTNPPAGERYYRLRN